MTSNIKNDLLAVVYITLLMMLMGSVYLYSGVAYLPFIAMHLTCFIAAYSLTQYIQGKSLVRILNLSNYLALPKRAGEYFAVGLLAATAIFLVMHYLLLGAVPIYEAFVLDNRFEVVQLRRYISTAAPSTVNYGVTYLIHGVFPFLIVYFYLAKKNRLFFFTLTLGVFYGMSLLHKSYPFFIVLPLIVLLAYQRYWVRVITVTLVMIAVIMIMSFAQNPHYRPDISLIENEHPSEIASDQSVRGEQRLAVGLVRRVAVVPGMVMSKWFEQVPSEIPFASGCGYRVVAKVKGCEFVNFPRVIWEKNNVHLSEKGLTGTMTTASFMNDYANFGFTGIIFSSVVLAVLLSIIKGLFIGYPVLALTLNIVPIVLLMLSPLTTVLNSGGWAVVVLLFFLAKKSLPKL